MKIVEALEVLNKDKEERKLIYGMKIEKVFNEVRLDILIDKAAAASYRAYLIMMLGVRPCKSEKIGWNLPLELVEEKYSDAVELTFKFKES